MREAGVPIAVATDCNPGTSPTVSPLLALNMACTLYGLTPEAALAGMTRHAATALGLQDETGIARTKQMPLISPSGAGFPIPPNSATGSAPICSARPLSERPESVQREDIMTDANARIVRSPRGPEITCKNWYAEAAMRMLMNNLDPDVAERPQDLVVYGGIGKAARNWNAFDTHRRNAAQSP